MGRRGPDNSKRPDEVVRRKLTLGDSVLIGYYRVDRDSFKYVGRSKMAR